MSSDCSRPAYPRASRHHERSQQPSGSPWRAGCTCATVAGPRCATRGGRAALRSVTDRSWRHRPTEQPLPGPVARWPLGASDTGPQGHRRTDCPQPYRQREAGASAAALLRGARRWTLQRVPLRRPRGRHESAAAHEHLPVPAQASAAPTPLEPQFSEAGGCCASSGASHSGASSPRPSPKTRVQMRPDRQRRHGRRLQPTRRQGTRRDQMAPGAWCCSTSSHRLIRSDDEAALGASVSDRQSGTR
jgi:hypothetical protein